MKFRTVAAAGPALLLILAQSAPVYAQGRQGGRRRLPRRRRRRRGRGGRGGIAGPGPAIGGDIDETPVVTHHSVTVGGKTLNYTATVAQMPLKNASGETEAHIFYMAYTLDGAERSREAAADVLLQRRPGLGVDVGAHGRNGSAQSETDAERQHASAAVSDERQPGHVARSDRPGVHRSGRHGIQPREDDRGRAAHERRAGRHSIGGRVHAHVHRRATAASFRRCSSRAKAMAPSARPAWPVT